MVDTTIKGLGRSPLPLPDASKPQLSKASVPFADALMGAVAETNRLQRDADSTAIKSLTQQDAGSLHQAMIALEKADISFKTMLQLRNRVLEAYQEIMRIQV